MSRDFQFDVFLSHSSKDKAVVEPLAERLRAQGLRVFLDKWCIEPGDDIYLAVEKGLEVSRILAFCASPNSIESEWAQLERSTIQFLNPINKKGKRRLIPLLLADCDLPAALQRLAYIDYRKHADEAFEALLKACRPADDEGATAADSTQGEGEPTAAERQHRCDDLLRLATLLLLDRKKLCTDLAQKVKMVLGHEKAAWPDTDHERLLAEIHRGLGTGQLLQIFLELYRKQDREERLEELLRLLLPVVFWTELGRYQAHITDRWMKLPIVETAYADIVQAAYDGRKIALFSTPEKALRSPLEIQAPIFPESGAAENLQREEVAAHLHNVLINTTLLREPFLTAHHKEITDQAPPEEQFKIRTEIVNLALEYERRVNNRIYFLLISKQIYKAWGKEADFYIQTFRELLPALRIVLMAGDWGRYSGETMELKNLHEILPT